MRLARFVLSLVASGMLPHAVEAAEGDVMFHQQVWPILERTCLKCHGTEKQKGGLRLDSREAALKGGDGGAAVVPGDLEKSLLLTLIQHSQPDGDRMPPKEKLHADEIAVMRSWITAGAPWPEKTAVSGRAARADEPLGNAWSDPRNPIVRIFGGRRLDLWSFRPIRAVTPPVVQNATWVRQPMDRFVLARIEAAGVQPAPEASRQTLARRVYFDVLGLPPSPEEVASFVADTAPDAFERLVDRLLASPRYGEHWARMWLDVVRYSDSNGFDWDEFRPEAWRFRDYVVRSFNSDKPFDEFVREQLAGDEMVPDAPRDSAQKDALIATGFLRLGPHDNSAALFGETAKVRQQLMNDLVETTGSAFLGMTLACSRCHDHKYDPISQADYYRMRAFFEPMQSADDLPIDLAHEQQSIREFSEQLQPRIDAVRKKIEQVVEPVKVRLAAERRERLSAGERTLIESPGVKPEGVTAEQIKRVREKIAVSDKDADEALDDEGRARRAELQISLNDLEKQTRKFTTALIAKDGKDFPVTRVLEGGNHEQERDPVMPGFLSALDPNAAEIRPPARAASTGRRSALAAWLVSEVNPLTARVMVNRVWQSYFGEGIVAAANDFGLAGERPKNPELLDWLAKAFSRRATQDSDQPALAWSLKALHRLILTSATYRQSDSLSIIESTVADELFARQKPRRLSAEALRDSMLAVSGRLLTTAGGPPVWPALQQEVLNANPAVLDDNKEKTKGWYPSPAEKNGVRSLYIIQKRNLRVPLLETFDLPENSTSCARRTISTVAPQALTLLNSPFAEEMARAFAERIEHDADGTAEAQVERAFALALQRSPDVQERLACVEFHEERGLRELCRAILNLNEFIYID